jgi:hypothetical protein
MMQKNTTYPAYQRNSIVRLLSQRHLTSEQCKHAQPDCQDQGGDYQ